MIRTPSWTDRIMYTTYADSPDTPEESLITNLLYTSIPSYTTSDHVSERSTLYYYYFNRTLDALFQKPIVSILLLPNSTSSNNAPPLLRLPSNFKPQPDRWAKVKRYRGRCLDRVVGYIWWFLTFFGAGSTVVGIFNFILGLGMWRWWRTESPTSGISDG